MSCLQNEALLEQCWEEAFESFRVSNKLTEAELNELLSFSEGTALAVERSARKRFESMCQ